MVQDSIVDGPGFRFVVFTQGCERHCEGCHNPETWDINAGSEISIEEIVELIEKNPLTDGLTLSGGEPFMQAAECARLASKAKQSGLNVWAYTGYTFEQLLVMAEDDPNVKNLLSEIDVLIDGAFVMAERTLMLRWRGSKNQRIVDIEKSLLSGSVVQVEI
jgi:anaerobic ribonucleoside-triphosphate reductase activating protein